MKNKLIYLLPTLFLAACTGNKETETTPGPLYPQPKTIELNNDKGYTLNTLTGDTIHPIITESGDSLITGVPIPVFPKKICSDSLDKPQVVPYLSSNVTYNAHPNVFTNRKEESKILPVTEQTFSIDQVKEIRVKSRKVKTIHPEPIPALPLRYKDAAVINLQYLDVQQGMPSSYVYAICEDHLGNLWFGTSFGGVTRYNGRNFVRYGETEGLGNNRIRSICEDKKGNLWFGTFGSGVTKYDGHNFYRYTEKEGLSNNIVWSILEDSKGQIWFTTEGGGVTKYVIDNKNGVETFTNYTTKEGLSSNDVRAVCEDKEGNLWFGTFEGSISKFTPDSSENGGIFTNYKINNGLIANNINSLIQDKENNLWAGTEGNGLIKFDGNHFTIINEDNGLSGNHVLSIKEDRNGDIWIGTFDKGITKFDGHSFTHIDDKNGLSNNRVLSIEEDRNGNLWFGTSGGGLTRYGLNKFEYFTQEQGLSNTIIWSILEDRNNNIWFATDGGGVTKYDGSRFTHFSEEEGLCHNKVRTILEDSDGNLWFGTFGGGVSKYVPDSTEENGYFINYSTEEGLSSNKILKIFEDREKNIWIGTYGGGITIYDGENFNHITQKEGLSHNIVRAILEDDSGNIWISTNGGGITKYDGTHFTHYTEREGLSSNVVWSMLKDDKGHIWIGTQGAGLSKFQPDTKGGGTITHFSETEGLNNNIIWSILKDNRNNIWTSTERGLNKLIMSEEGNNSKVKIIQYSRNDGLKGVDFYHNSAHFDSKDRAWWGSGKSLIMLDIGTLGTSNHLPTIQLNQLNINQNYLDYRNLGDGNQELLTFSDIERFQNYPNNLELPHNKNHLTFHYTAIDWAAPHKLKYSYMLEGLSEGWSKPTYENKADYRNIPYGKYVFKVSAIGESGEWSEAFEYEFTIHPPWWHTWWARLLYILTGLMSTLWFVRWRTTKLRERQKELENEVEIATKEIREQKDQVEEAHKEITDSINYAERIQRSFLATEELLLENLNEHFVFFQPKEVVSGDFYWAGKLNNGTFAMVNADSTGHGVPGAIMSILNISSLEKAIEKGAFEPAKIFNDTRRFIIERLKKDGSPEGGKDGMDASIICFDFQNNKFTYTAAQNPIWVIRDGKLTEIKPEKMPIGKHDKDHIPFEGGEFKILKGDLIYTLTDGFQDQFGGPKGKKFMVKKMREYILSISHLSMEEQYQKIKETFNHWKGEIDQVDDVCVIGVKI
ncbi:MAG: SpoIIE family protein phosphatase [Crocinitomicaceae bacterium]|nr:SpoIIE family protein phosphatase [Crocinitomicaceae bacterium]